MARLHAFPLLATASLLPRASAIIIVHSGNGTQLSTTGKIVVIVIIVVLILLIIAVQIRRTRARRAAYAGNAASMAIPGPALGPGSYRMSPAQQPGMPYNPGLQTYPPPAPMGYGAQRQADLEKGPEEYAHPQASGYAPPLGPPPGGNYSYGYAPPMGGSSSFAPPPGPPPEQREQLTGYDATPAMPAPSYDGTGAPPIPNEKSRPY
ncbi:Rho1 GTPase [Mycena chlorophos]|uniref:Rho1 GTPase n=1 Tax=Mycena chlorophos TaxID=658473 RepID=A0A8H6TS58_MYCCL|nr:Rho1 GTPase [Mycena chlorophos]